MTIRANFFYPGTEAYYWYILHKNMSDIPRGTIIEIDFGIKIRKICEICKSERRYCTRINPTDNYANGHWICSRCRREYLEEMND